MVISLDWCAFLAREGWMGRTVIVLFGLALALSVMSNRAGAELDEEPRKWTLSVEEDPMTDAEVAVASVESQEGIQGIGGKEPAVFGARCARGRVLFAVFARAGWKPRLEEFFSLRIRIDAKKARKADVGAATSQMLIFVPVEGFEAELLGARRMLVQAETLLGSETMEFDLRDLPNKIDSVRKGCE